jgi:histone H4
MAGRGKNAKLASKNKAKRTMKDADKELKNGVITNGALRRMARRGGVRRMSVESHDQVREYIDDFLNKVVRDSLTYTEHRKGQTITAMDVVYALKKNGRVLYGYGL